MTERIRLTISITPEVHALFSRMAETGGISLGRCIGDWLENTSEGAEFVANEARKVRELPRRVLEDIGALSRGIDRLAVSVARSTWPAEGTAAAGRTAGQERKAPSSNTGLNPPRGARRSRP